MMKTYVNVFLLVSFFCSQVKEKNSENICFDSYEKVSSWYIFTFIINTRLAFVLNICVKCVTCFKDCSKKEKNFGVCELLKCLIHLKSD